MESRFVKIFEVSDINHVFSQSKHFIKVLPVVHGIAVERMALD